MEQICLTESEIRDRWDNEFKYKHFWMSAYIYKHFSTDFLREFEDQLSWNDMSWEDNLLTDPQIREFANKLNWSIMKISYKSTLKDDLKERYKEELNT